MIAISSRSSGVILFPKPKSSDYTVIDVVERVEKDPAEAQYLYTNTRDWEEIEGDDITDLLEIASQKYWLTRTVSHIRLAIGGLEKSLEKRVLEDIEENLSSRVSPEEVLNHLLIAPLADPQSPVALTKAALSHGFSVVASILDGLIDIQPLLSRLTSRWLGLPDVVFSNLSESREMIWVTVVEKGDMRELLKTGNKNDFETKWNLLAWNFPIPKSRSGIITLGKELSCQLFPGDESEKILTCDQIEEAELMYDDGMGQGESSYEAFQRTQKQILAIVKAVSEGRDNMAEKFLRELIQVQTSVSGGESYAVKSLCNIAQYCADMFRTDFEIICLNMALELKLSDAWALIQKGDYLKRMGHYDEALVVLKEAQSLGENIVGKSSEADVYSQQCKYGEAIEIYKTIPNWREKPAVLTAIADNLRKLGKMDESRSLYKQIIDSPQFVNAEYRALAGLAEIEKKQGKLEEALLIYQEILSLNSHEDRDKVFYRLGLCNVLKLMGEFKEAYTIVENVIEDYPFAMQARFIRGSILGLIGKEKEGLIDLPERTGDCSWREWLRRYYRGLLLFRLERYEDAKKNLVEELNKAIASEEEKSLLRMAAALCFLKENETVEADVMLSKIPDLIDNHIRYLSLVLKLHLATRKEDSSKIKQLKRHIAKLQVRDEGLDKAVEALDKRNFADAFICETDALLKLAA